MKILQVTTHFNIGGISNYILTLSKALKDKGVDVVVASSGGDLAGELDKYSIKHVTLDMKTKFEFGPKALTSAFRLSGIIEKEDVDIIHAHTRVSQVAAGLASNMRGARLVTTCHGYFKKRMRGLVDTWGVKVIAISDAVKTHLIEDLGVDETRVALVYSGVEIARFSGMRASEISEEAKRSMGLSAGPVVGTVGRLSTVKGQKFLIEAMKYIIAKRPDAQAVILGSGEEDASLKRLAASLGVAGSVRFFESCPDTRKFLSTMDVFVLPSVKEGLGIALLEALAAGRACIASRVGGIEDIIKDGYNGILVDVGDAAAIGEVVLKLLADDKLRKDIGENGMRLVKERFSLDRMADDVIKVYREALA